MAALLRLSRGFPSTRALTLSFFGEPGESADVAYRAGSSRVITVDADDFIFEQLTAIVARLEMHIEQLTIHVDELKSHTCKEEVASEKARIKLMSNELERLIKLKELYATRLTDRIYTHH
jgi:hypothetical protein